MKKILAISLCFLSFTLLAQETPDKMIEQFFQKVEQDSVRQAIDYIFSINRIDNFSQSQIESLKVQLESTHKALGELNGQNQIVVRKLSDALLIFSYLMKYEVQPIRFNFVFYNPNGQWRLQKFWYDDDVLDELSSAININRQRVLNPE